MFKWIKRLQGHTVLLASKTSLQNQQLRQDGNALLAKGDLGGAEQCYREAVAADPADVLARVNLGFVLLQQQRADEAMAELNAALALDENNVDCHYLLGGLSEKRCDLQRASLHYQRAFELKPDFELACRDACRVLFNLGKVVESRLMIAAGLALNPKFADFHFYEGNLHLADRALDWALESYREALALGADYAALHGFLGGVLLQRNDIGAALGHLRRAIELDSGNTEAHHDLGVVFQRLGKIEQAIEQQRIAITQDPGLLQAHSCLLFALSCSTDCSPQQYLAAAQYYAAQVRKTVQPLIPLPDLPALLTQGPLRIGWVSGDFRKHVNSSFLRDVLPCLVNESLELIAFSNNPYDDEVTHMLRGQMAEWHDIAHLSDHDAASLIQSRCIDVLIDLAGHTAHNRLPVFAWRPAPVQVSWLGYFASTGMAEMDYFLADHVSVPAEWHSHFSECVWYLPDTRLCMAHPLSPDLFPVNQLPALSAGYITFGCFQALGKVNDAVLKAWAQVMTRVPGSRLRMQVRHLELPGVRDALLCRLAHAGISPDLVLLQGGAPVNDYLAAHNEVDMILDTFPYPGGTTTAEALWMGVPSVTLRGNSLLARQGASMLTAAGLSDWIAIDEADYVNRAIRLASDLLTLANLRRQLREQVLASPLFDSQRFAKHLVTALHAMSQARRSRL